MRTDARGKMNGPNTMQTKLNYYYSTWFPVEARPKAPNNIGIT